METFQPLRPSLMKQIWVSPVFLIGLTLAVVMASVIFIRQKQSEEIASRAQLLRSGPVIVESASVEGASQAPASEIPAASNEAIDTQPPADGSAATTVASADSPSAMPMSALGKSLASETEATPEPTKTDSGKNPAAANRRINLTATYAEVRKNVLTQIEEASQSTNQFTDFGTFKAGALPDTKSVIRNVRVLQRITKSFDGKTNQQRWLVGGKAGDEEIGLTTLVTIEPSSDGHIHGEVEILRSLPEADSAGVVELVKKSYPISSFDVAPGSGWMVHLSDLPQLPANTLTSDLTSQGFLRLFKLDSFIKSETEFTLFLEFDSPTP